MNEKVKKQLQEADELYEQYQKYKWPAQHWRAWGSWFSWGSPVGLGLFFVLLATAAAILVWVTKL